SRARRTAKRQFSANQPETRASKRALHSLKKFSARESAKVETLSGKIALVTGASRGVGKGIALELLAAGATVYITGRCENDMTYIAAGNTNCPGAAAVPRGIPLVCDHRDDEQVRAAFRRITDEQGRLDLLVNNAWGGYENMMENGQFTWTKPFW